MSDGLARVIALAGPNTKVVPGHGPIVDRSAVMAHRDVLLGVQRKVSDLVRQGKSEGDTVAAKPAGEFSSRVPEGGPTEDRFVGQVFQELKAN
jgi:glyoxylase-like metal-dependent hydrolase (beta-lactamase superfamily II)